MVNKVLKVNKGSHLTVTTYLDGSTKLEWDDEALLRDVRIACAKAELEKKVPSEKTKAINRIKKGK
jgi:hypothetical protein